MTLHKLAAGSGSSYLTRQVAAHDTTELGQLGLAAYYEEKGESLGRWIGRGLGGLDPAGGDLVTEEQMKLLFGQGRHPHSKEPDCAIGGLSWLSAAPATLREHPCFGPYLDRMTALINELDTAVSRQAGSETEGERIRSRA